MQHPRSLLIYSVVNIAPCFHLIFNLAIYSASFKIMSSTSAQGLTALSSTLLGLSTIAITLRFYARHVQKAPVKSDDWFMVPCLVCG